MEVMKVKRYRPAPYPDKEAVRQDGSLLQSVPARWKKNTAVCAALAITGTMVLAGCDDGTARVFSHGRGVNRPAPSLRTDVVGMVMPPLMPIILDEKEAFRIIVEEMEEYGFHFSQDSFTVESAQIPMAELNGRNMTVFTKSSEDDLLMDGYDEKKKVAYEFVSSEDVLAWKAWDKQESEEKQITLDLRAGAQALARNLDGKTGETVVAVFYDPVNGDANHLNRLSAEDVIKLQQQDQENLRRQVRDFIAWLKAQGIV